MMKEKVKTGIPGLDEMLEGGLIPARAYVVSGTSGTGKTTLAMQFLLEGARSGERVIYIALDEPPNEVKQNMRSYGWDIDRVQVFDATADVMSYDKTPVRDVSTERKVTYFRDVGDGIRLTSEKSPADMTINTIQEILKQEMKVRKYTRIVVDSLTSLRYFYIRTSEENATLMSFFRLLSDLGVTSILTVQLPEISKPDIEIHVARGEIRLHKWINGRGLMRGATVEKYRGSAHDQRLRTMKMTSEGIVIKETPQEKEEAPEEGQEAAPHDGQTRQAGPAPAVAGEPEKAQTAVAPDPGADKKPQPPVPDGGNGI
jgi:KaiC/GvpD/RAD55 family RecA-like ATPase